MQNSAGKWSWRPDPYFTVGFASVAVMGVIYLYSTRVSATAQASVPPPSLIQSVRAKTPGRLLGDSSSPVRVVELMDYQCSACAVTHRATWELLKRRTAAGTAVFEQRNVPLPAHANAVPAAVFAECVNRIAPERYWEFHGALLSRQAAWAERYPVEPVLLQIAASSGVDSTAVRECAAASGDGLARGMRDAFAMMSENGYSYSPVWLVNGKVVRWDRIDAEIQAAAEEGRP